MDLGIILIKNLDETVDTLLKNHRNVAKSLKKPLCMAN